MSPTFLTLDEVLALHAEATERFGGGGGIRDVGLLESALGTPQATFGAEWLHPSLPEMASAYLFHICKNHPFVDGNKRAALASALVFLGVNGMEVDASESEMHDLVLGVAAGTRTKADVSVFFTSHAYLVPR